MDLKKLLKAIKLNESTISMILGVIVIVITGYILINLLKKDSGEIIPPVGIEHEEMITGGTHIVQKGEDLWKIAENYYQDGYKWVEIAQANRLESPYVISEGQTLTIPDLNKIADSTSETQEKVQPTVADEEINPTEEPIPTQKVATEDVVVQEPEIGSKGTEIENQQGKNVYVVKHGDSLWKIAEAQYGDPYRWVEISKANDLVNPSIIHAGNEFVIPE